MAPLLLLLLVALPFVELWLLLQLAATIGPGPTLLLVVLSGLLGSALARWQGVTVLRRLREDLAAGRTPGDALLDGALVLVGAALLILPGVLTDVAGLLLLFPPTRALARLALARWARGRVQVVSAGLGPTGPRRTDVIDVEAVVRDPTSTSAAAPPALKLRDPPGA